MTIGVILAGGKGKRFGAEEKNKTAELFNGKPLVMYGVELFEKTVDKLIVVLGVAPKSVTEAIGRNEKVDYAFQTELLGTGNAFRVAMEQIISLGLNPDLIFVGYGDHMMFYQKEMLDQMSERVKNGAAVTLVTTTSSNPDKLVWGRIIRVDGNVVGIVEQKDATEDQRKIDEVNAGFYCFDFRFAKENYGNLQKSEVTGEFYLTDMVKLATQMDLKVEAVTVPFEQVGIGINTREELKESEQLFKSKCPDLSHQTIGNIEKLVN